MAFLVLISDNLNEVAEIDERSTLSLKVADTFFKVADMLVSPSLGIVSITLGKSSSVYVFFVDIESLVITSTTAPSLKMRLVGSGITIMVSVQLTDVSVLTATLSSF